MAGKRRAQSLTEAARTNDQRKTLIALRDKIAATIEMTDSGRDVAALSKRLMEVMGEIAALPDPGATDDPIEAAQKACTR